MAVKFEHSLPAIVIEADQKFLSALVATVSELQNLVSQQSDEIERLKNPPADGAE